MSFSLPTRWFGRHERRGARAGIALADGAFALAVVRRDGDARPAIEHCATQPVAAVATEFQPALKAALDKLGAARAAACAVIDGDDYQIVQVEAPEVLPSEMRAAIRWRLRDAIGFSVDEAAVDVFETPEPVRRAQSRMLFAVAARDSAVQRIAGLLKPVARGFHAIDIPELCLRNLSALLPQDQKGVAMVALGAGFAQLVVTRQGTMYLTRRIDTARRFEKRGDAASPDQPIDAVSLALELQRSLDYYESQFDQTPIGDLVIAPANEQARQLAVSLKNEIGLRISVLDARDICTVYPSGELVTDWPSLMALGAALRVEKVEL